MLGGMAVLVVLGLAFGAWKKLKNFSTFFKKTIDKQIKVCYNKDNEREVINNEISKSRSYWKING
jgi:hypothetical protein